MTLHQFHHEKGPAGADYAAADDGADLRTGPANGKITYETVAKRHGALGLKFANVSGANCIVRRLITPTRTLSFRYAFSADTVGTQVLQVKNASDGNIIRIEYRSATGYIAVTDVANTVFATSNNVADSALNTIHEIAVHLTIDPTTATAGKITARRYDEAGNGIGIPVSVTNANLGTAPAQRIDYGNVSGGTARVVLGDDLQWDDAQAVLLPPMTEPPVVVDPPPTPVEPRPDIFWMGDSKTHQDGTGPAAIQDAFNVFGWQDSEVVVSGVSSRVPWDGTVTPTTKTSYEAMVASGFAPEYIGITLGGNIRGSQQSTWQYQFDQLYAMLGSTKPIFALNIAYKDPNEGVAFNNWFAGFVASKPNMHLIDHYGMIRAREAAGQTVSWAGDGLHLVPGPTGYGLINTLAAQTVNDYRLNPGPMTPPSNLPISSLTFDNGVADADILRADVGASVLVAAGGYVKYRTSRAVHGPLGAEFRNSEGNVAILRREVSFTKKLVIDAVLSWSTENQSVIAVYDTAGAWVGFLQSRAGGGLSFLARGGVYHPIAANGSGLANLNTTYRVSLTLAVGTSTTTGKITAELRALDGTKIGSTLSVTNANLGTADLGSFDVGVVTTSLATTGVDDVQWQPGGTTFLPALTYTSPPPKLASITAQEVEFPALVTVKAVPESGSPTSYRWSQIGGNPVVWTKNPGSTDTGTFVAPADEEGETFRFSVVGINSSGESPAVEATVVVLPHLTWYKDSDNTWKPYRIILDDPSWSVVSSTAGLGNGSLGTAPLGG